MYTPERVAFAKGTAKHNDVAEGQIKQPNRAWLQRTSAILGDVNPKRSDHHPKIGAERNDAFIMKGNTDFKEEPSELSPKVSDTVPSNAPVVQVRAADVNANAIQNAKYRGSTSPGAFTLQQGDILPEGNSSAMNTIKTNAMLATPKKNIFHDTAGISNRYVV